ncbi:hypothetical protein [Deinococcus marmoris]|uniref:hypothetical protein n=1 Tax=Deinococcus marmoris TaxID=249408 RepID=UPI0012DCC8E3|nr:hypothetical protein [Deinococcus marmoris]
MNATRPDQHLRDIQRAQLLELEVAWVGCDVVTDSVPTTLHGDNAAPATHLSPEGRIAARG